LPIDIFAVLSHPSPRKIAQQSARRAIARLSTWAVLHLEGYDVTQLAARSREREQWRALVCRLFRPLNTPLGASTLTLLAYGLLTLARLQAFGGDVTRFVLASARFIPLPVGASVGLSLTTTSNGYDGQFYYLLALNPFSSVPALPGAHFDVPAYRAQRILYPLLVWALSLGGRPALVPAVLVIVNLVAIVGVCAIGTLFARQHGIGPLWGLLLAFYPGLLVSLAGDLAEPLAVLCALSGLLCARRHRWGWAALLLSLAVLARETTALIAVAMVIAGLLARLRPAAQLPELRTAGGHRMPRDHWSGAVVSGGIPLVVALCWQFILLMRWGSLGILAAGTNNLGIPLVGLVESVVAWTVLWAPLMLVVHCAEAVYLVGLAEMTRRLLWSHRCALEPVGIAWGLFAALALTLSVYVWDFYWNFLRGTIELGMLSLLLLLLLAPLRWRRIALAATLALWAVTSFVIAPLTPPPL
jgi:hypothetical protein